MSSIEERCRQLIVQGGTWLAGIARVKSEADRFQGLKGRFASVLHRRDPKRVRHEDGMWSVNEPSGIRVRPSVRCWSSPTFQGSLAGGCVPGHGNFVISNIVDAPGHPNDGLLLAYEGDNVTVNNQTVFETLPGAPGLGTAYAGRPLDGLCQPRRQLRPRGLLPAEGLIVDHYHVARARFVRDPDNPLPGRPVLDAGALVQLARATGNDTYLRAFMVIALGPAEEAQPGTWIVFPPWHPDTGRLHIRTSWWWGYPLLQAYDLSGDTRFWQATLRVGDWYFAQQNLDGGFYYSPLETASTSASGWRRAARRSPVLSGQTFTVHGRGTRNIRTPSTAACASLLAAQFSPIASDPDIAGRCGSRPIPPMGRRAGFLIRDIATIFGNQALDRALNTADLLKEIAPAGTTASVVGSRHATGYDPHVGGETLLREIKERAMNGRESRLGWRCRHSVFSSARAARSDCLRRKPSPGTR